MAEERTHQRVNDILLGPLERPALAWLAAHMPAWMTPDKLTGIGILGTLMIFSGYALSQRNPGFLWLASLGFIVNWFGDSLDGTLARYRKIERPKYGYFVDHAVDAFSQVLIFTGLGLSPYVSLEIALLALVGYTLMSILVYLRTYVEGVFQISYIGIGPTEMRVIAILLNLAFFLVPDPRLALPLGDIRVYDLFTGFIAAVLLAAYLVSAIQYARRLARQEARQ